MYNITIPHVTGSHYVAPCMLAQFNIISAHMIALHHACTSRAGVFALFESDFGAVHRPLESLPFPDRWCVINVCPTNSAEPWVDIRRAVAPHDFGAVAVVYNHRCVCNKLNRLWRRFTSTCEPYDTVIHSLPHSYRTGVMWVEHKYAPSTHSYGWYHKLGPKLVQAARAYHRGHKKPPAH